MVDLISREIVKNFKIKILDQECRLELVQTMLLSGIEMKGVGVVEIERMERETILETKKRKDLVGEEL